MFIKAFIRFICLICCFSFASYNHAATNDNYEALDEATEIASISAVFLYNLDRPKLESTLSVIFQNDARIKAVRIIDNLDDSAFFTFYRYNAQLIFNERIPVQFLQYDKAVRPVTYNEEVIGSIELFYDTPNDLSEDNQDQTMFNAAERDWIENNPTLKVGVFKWPPLISPEGEHQAKGLLIDYLNLISQKSDLHFEYVHGRFTNLISDFKAGELDILPGLTYHPSRDDWGIFSRSLINVRYRFFVRESDRSIQSSADLEGMKVAVIKADIASKYITERYPGITLVEMNTDTEMIDALLNKQVAALAAAEQPLFHALETKNIAGVRGLTENIIPVQQQQLLTPNQSPLLSSIIEKSLSQISEAEKAELFDKYRISHTKEPLSPQTTQTLNIKISILLGFFVLTMAILYFGAHFIAKHRQFENSEFTFGTKRFANLIKISITLFLTVIAAVMWVLLDKNKLSIEQKVSEALTIAIASSESELRKIKTNYDSIQMYFNTRKELTDFFEQLSSPPEGFDIQGAKTGFEHFGERYRALTNDSGIVVIDLNEKALIRSGNQIDHQALIEQFPDAYDQAIQGQTSIVAPQSFMAGTNDNTLMHMYVFLPISVNKNNVQAIIIYELQPQTDFYRANNTYLLGETADVFAVNAGSDFISPSRLNKENGSVELNKPAFPSETDYAIEHLRLDGNTIHNKGFKHSLHVLHDYRGKVVYAQLHWLSDFDIGIVAKIDQDEALAQHYAFRSSLFMIMLLMLAFTLPVLLITLNLGRRANERLLASHEELEHMVEDRTTDLIEMEQHTRLLLASVGQGLFGLDRDENITFINDAALNILGFSRLDEVDINKAFYSAPNSARELFETTLRSGDTLSSREHTFTRANGDTIPVELTSRAIIKQEQIVGTMVVFSDISEQLKLQAQLMAAIEQAKDASQAKSQFLANMSHEIRTPMNAILGMSHLVLQTSLDAKQKNFIEKVHRSAQSLLGIINDILDFSKIEAGRLEMERTSFYLDDVLDDIADVIGLKTAEKGLEFMFDVAAEIPQPLIGDPLRLKQILFNLSTNAAKFTEQGEIILKIAPPEDKGDWVQLTFSIKDTGIGMTEAQVKKLFESFSQADTSTTRKYGGTGLGLVISKRLVNMMHGDIWVESQPNQGTCFSFNAWFKRSKQSQIPKPSTLFGQNERALVVDDCHTSRLIIQDMLRTQGYQVELCEDGEQALDLLAKHPSNYFQLILLDWKMPRLDGHATAMQMSTMFKDAPERPKVIMITAFDKDDASAAAQDVDLIDGYISKPLVKASLFNLIATAQSGHADGKPVHRDSNKQLEAAIASLAGANILVVEDNDINQELTSELLTSNGLKVTIAENGQVALDKLAQERFDGILMDCEMPIMDGYEATRRIREQAQYQTLPILAMTAHAMTGDSEKVLQAGMNEHIAKPIDVADVFLRMAKWIKPATAKAPLHTQQQVKANELNPALRSIDALDVDAGLATCQHKASLYEKLLAKFVLNHEQFEQQLNAADPDERKRLIHTLKGVAGNIGAKAIHKQCVAHEQLSEELDGLEFKQASLTALVAQLNSLCSAIKLALDHEQTHQQAAPSTNQAELEQNLASLRLLLEQDDTDAVDLFDKIADALNQHKTLTPLLNGMTKAMSGYDFDEAKAQLDALEQALSELNKATEH